MTIIKYNSDELKKERIMSAIRANQGITAHRLYYSLSMESRTYQKLIREMVKDGQVVLKPGYHNAILHYVRA